MYCIGYCTGCVFLYKNNTWLPSWSSGVRGPCWVQSLGKGALCPGVGNAHAPWTAGVTLGTNVLGTKSAKKRHKNWAAKMKALPISLNDFRPADSVCVHRRCAAALLQELASVQTSPQWKCSYRKSTSSALLVPRALNHSEKVVMLAKCVPHGPHWLPEYFAYNNSLTDQTVCAPLPLCLLFRACCRFGYPRCKI